MSVQFDPILGDVRDGAVSLAEQLAGFNSGTTAQQAAFQASVSGPLVIKGSVSSAPQAFVGADGLPIFWTSGLNAMQAGTELVTLGDSRTEANTFTSGTNTDNTTTPMYIPNGTLQWALAKSNADLRLVNNAGKGGDTVVPWAASARTGMTARLATDVFPYFTGTKHKLVDYMAGINDATEGIPIATTIAGHKAIIDSVLAQGCQIIVTASPSKTSGGTTVTNHVLAQRAFLRQYCEGRVGAVFVDGWAPTCQANGDFLGNMSYDGTHLLPKGAYFVGSAKAAALAGKVKTIRLPIHPSDNYGADNTSRNWQTKSNMQGTSGVVGTNVTGQVADGYNVQGQTGIAIVASKLSSDLYSGGTFAQRMVVTATGPGYAQIIFPYIGNLAGMTAADYWRTACAYSISGASALTAMHFETYHSGGSPVRYGYWGFETTSFGGSTITDMYLPDHSGVMQTRPALVGDPTAGNIQGQLLLKFSGTGGATIDLGPWGAIA